MWHEDLRVYESCWVCVYCIMWQPERMWSRSAECPGSKARERTLLRGGATRPDSGLNLGRLCMAASAYTGPKLWKATVLFTVKGSDGPPSEEGPLCPSLCVCVHEWEGGEREGMFGPGSEDFCVAAHQFLVKTCLISLIWSSVDVNHWCVCVCVASGLPTHKHAYTGAIK